ncbi:MAG TPA: arsenate reductase ArsC [bacterium]|nr:arsenate reductase ArsC [bacterium]
MTKPNILVLCTGNSARSQMAEGLLRRAAGDRFDVFSAGLEPKGVHPMAIRVMAEIGIDIGGHKSKGVEEFLGKKTFRHVISVCDHASRSCPRLFPGVSNMLHWSIEDPAAFQGNDDDRLEKFREVRDQIVEKIKAWVPTVKEKRSSV